MDNSKNEALFQKEDENYTPGPPTPLDENNTPICPNINYANNIKVSDWNFNIIKQPKDNELYISFKEQVFCLIFGLFFMVLFVWGMIATIIINRDNIEKVFILIIILPCFAIPIIPAFFCSLFFPLTLKIKLKENGIQIIKLRFCICFFTNKFYRKDEIIKFDIEYYKKNKDSFDLILIKSDGRKIRIISDISKAVEIDETKNLIKFLNKYINEQMKKDVELDTDTKLCL